MSEPRRLVKDNHTAAEVEEEERLRQSFFESILTQSASLMFGGEVQTPPTHFTEQYRDDNDHRQDRPRSAENIDTKEATEDRIFASKQQDIERQCAYAHTDAPHQASKFNEVLIKPPLSHRDQHPAAAPNDGFEKIDRSLQLAYRYLVQVDSSYPSASELPSTLSAISLEGEESFAVILEKVTTDPHRYFGSYYFSTSTSFV